ncbi:MAG TPA: lactonase family protein [Caulobacteraceae bacterium]|nr:lactonase family protein [Caulobacteraceae bacterium]
MHQNPAVVSSLCLSLLLHASPVSAAPRSSERVYIGTQGGDGVFVADFDEATGHLSKPSQAIALLRAQWLALNPTAPVLYAVGATPAGRDANGRVYSLAIDPVTGGLKPIGDVDSGGREPTYLSFDPRTNTLFNANYDSGTIAALPVLADGSLGPVAALQQDSGSGPFPVRQAHAIAHCIVLDPSGKYVLVADLGADRVFVYRFDPATRALTPAGSQALPAGSGPRHLVFDPRGKFVYVLTELTAEVHVLAWDGRRGRLRPVQSLSAYPAGSPDEAGAAPESKGGAELHTSPNGRFLYVTLRGKQNSIVAYAIAPRTGRLREIQRLGSGGLSPVGFAFDPTGHWMLVANDGSNAISVMKVDSLTGELQLTDQTAPISKPRDFVFYPN